jgi:hypothetical protein
MTGAKSNMIDRKRVRSPKKTTNVAKNIGGPALAYDRYYHEQPSDIRKNQCEPVQKW